MKPFPYQIEGVDFLANHPNALLADTMGLGKTVQAILAAAKVLGPNFNPPIPAVMVVCPASVVAVWLREIDVWWPEGQAKPFFDVISYDYLTRHLSRYIDVAYSIVILDEAHYLKNPKAKRTKAVFGDRMTRHGGVTEKAKHVWCLTGTPAPNNPSELWPMLHSLNPGALTPPDKKKYRPWNFYQFTRKFCTMRHNGFAEVVTGGKNLPELRERMAPFTLRRMKEQVLKDLPSIRFAELPLHCKKPAYEGLVEASAQAAELARVLEHEGVGGLRRLAPEMATLRRITALAKVSALVEWIKESFYNVHSGGNSKRHASDVGIPFRHAKDSWAMPAGPGEKLVIFAHHVAAIEALEQALSPCHPVVVRGGISGRARQDAIDKFQRPDSTTRVFIGQIQAAGTGITLTAASDIVFLEQSWTPANNAQAAMRIHRIGQNNACLVRTALLPGSVDELVQKTLLRKTEDLVALFDGVA